jgi:hypothetical protein
VKLDVSIQADLDKWSKGELDKGARAVSAALRRTARRIEKDFEAATEAASLGRLAKAWQSRVYPAVPSLGASALVYAKGKNTPAVLAAFATGVTIRAKTDGSATFLAIPTPAAPKRGRDGKRISPSNWPNERFGRLRYVFRRGRPALLVVDGLRATKRGGFARNRGRNKEGGEFLRLRNAATVVMFVLVPQARLAKRFDVETVVRGGLNALPGEIASIWDNSA